MAGPAGGFDKPISRRASQQGRPGCLVAFFGVFLMVGLGMLALFGWSIYMTIVARTTWTEVPCEVLESGVGSHSDSDGTTYSVDVRYRYSVDGRSYESDRYRFLQGSSSGYEGKAEAVEALPPGTVTTCRVDPEDPTEAVLHTGFDAVHLLILFPIPFIVVGGGGVFFTLAGLRKKRRRAAQGVAEWLPATEGGGPGDPAAGAATPAPPLGVGTASAASAPAGAGPMVLEAQFSPFGKLVLIVLIAAFWNGITGVFVWQVWKSWAAGSPDGCLTIFILPFVLIGLLFLAGVPYTFLTLFNPRPRLEIAPGRIALGGSHQLRWSFRGRAGRIRRLKITLVGVEEADYRQGTTTRTDTETFATLELLNETQSLLIREGSTSIAIPADTMHSFEAPDNRIEWKLKLQGEIAYWPDVIEEFPLTVEPLPVEAET